MTWPRITFLTAVAVAASIGVLATPVAAQSDSSSWITRNGPAPATDAPAGQPKKPAEAKILKSAPAGQVKRLPTLPAQVPGATTVEKSGSISRAQAAYELFEQGKYLSALQLAQAAAEDGDRQAHTLVGRIHAEGLGVAQNPGLAAKWYERGAELGDIESMFGLAVLLAEGTGVERDRVAAARMFDRAAQSGHVLANYNLALLFLKGDGKPENPYRAAAHLRYAAEQGLAAAQYDLGTLYATGTGVDANAVDAALWIGRAAAGGLVDARVDYAFLLFRGQGVPVDQKMGVEQFRAAAQQGSVVAQNRLARCYLHGAGVEQSVAEAAKWHLIAKAGGEADDALDQVLAKMPRKDRETAEREAIAWRERALVRTD